MKNVNEEIIKNSIIDLINLNSNKHIDSAASYLIECYISDFLEKLNNSLKRKYSIKTDLLYYGSKNHRTTSIIYFGSKEMFSFNCCNIVKALMDFENQKDKLEIDINNNAEKEFKIIKVNRAKINDFINKIKQESWVGNPKQLVCGEEINYGRNYVEYRINYRGCFLTNINVSISSKNNVNNALQQYKNAIKEGISKTIYSLYNGYNNVRFNHNELTLLVDYIYQRKAQWEVRGLLSSRRKLTQEHIDKLNSFLVSYKLSENM